MELRRLYRTIEELASRQYSSDEELLEFVMKEIVRHDEIPIRGGRVWKFEPRTGSYVLVHQVGDIDKIRQQYKVKVKEYPMFLEMAKQRTVLANETDVYLRKRGILKYSATGVGEKMRWKGHGMYPYALAFNVESLAPDLSHTLNIISTAISSAMKGKKSELKAQQLERDLDKAREIQKRILPEHEIRFHKYEVYGLSVPSRIVGGDFFDYIRLTEDSERLGIAIGDAASKGLSAAAQALYVSGALRMGAEFETKISSLVTKINKLMHKTFPDENFVSLFYGEITNDKNGLLIYANAGHNSPMLLHSDCADVETLGPTGQMLGPFPNETYRTESAMMKAGDVLLLYTDGVVEAADDLGEFFGEKRVADFLCAHRKKSAKEITQLLMEEVQKYDTNIEYTDDKTIVVIKRTP